MEKFRYNKGWKVIKFLACGYPITGLLGIAAYGLFAVLPSRNYARRYEFNWWVPYLVIALLAWAILEIRNLIKTLRFSLEISDECIRLGADELRWEDVGQTEFRNAVGSEPAIVLMAKSGKIINIPAATESLQRIKDYIEAHTNATSRV